MISGAHIVNKLSNENHSARVGNIYYLSVREKKKNITKSICQKGKGSWKSWNSLNAQTGLQSMLWETRHHQLSPPTKKKKILHFIIDTTYWLNLLLTFLPICRLTLDFKVQKLNLVLTWLTISSSQVSYSLAYILSLTSIT